MSPAELVDELLNVHRSLIVAGDKAIRSDKFERGIYEDQVRKYDREVDKLRDAVLAAIRAGGAS